jgi:hypothetical protein
MEALVYRLALTLSLALLAACGARAGHGPTSFDRELAAMAASEALYGPPRNAKPLPLAPGQWVRQHVVDQDGHHALVTTKVIALFGRQVWLESETESEAGTRAIKLLLSLGDRKDPKTIDIYQYWVKGADGSVEQLQPMLLGSMKPKLQTMLADVLIAHRPDAQEDVAVTAGRFARAYKARVKVKSLGGSAESDTWWHSGVPLNGSLRTVRVSAPGSSELVAFGLSGARSAF